MIRYDRSYDLELLASDMEHTPLEIKRKVLYTVYLTGLMQVPLLRYIPGFNKKFAEQTLKTKDFHIKQMWKELQRHITDGKDKTDKRSAGGFNQDELADLIEILEGYGYVVPNESVK